MGGAPRVLIVERDPSLRKVVAARLSDAEVEVREHDGRDDLGAVAARVQADVVVLELAGYTGTERLTQVRAVTDAPVIALLDRIVDCVDALEQGADDYLEKPLAPRELVAKIRSALRRTRRSSRSGRFEVGDLVVDLGAREVLVEGHTIAMPARELDLLAHLAGSPGRTFSRTALLQEVWHASDGWLGPATVTEHVRRVRRRIERDPTRPRRLVTVRGSGYRLAP